MLCCTNSLLPVPCRHPGRACGPSRTGAARSGADHRPAGWGTASSSASASLVTCGQPADPWARPPSGAPSPPAGPGETRPVVCALVVGGCHTAGADRTESCCSSAPCLRGHVAPQTATACHVFWFVLSCVSRLWRRKFAVYPAKPSSALATLRLHPGRCPGHGAGRCEGSVPCGLCQAVRAHGVGAPQIQAVMEKPARLPAP